MTKSAIKTLLNGIKALIPNPQVQSDYAENNSNSISYIKNRPFYKDKETEEVKQIGEEFIPPISAENVYFDEDLSTDYDGAQTVEEGFRKVVSMIDSIDITEELDVLREEFDEKIEELSKQIIGEYTILKDAINGYNYVVQMRNGKLVSYCSCASITVVQMPNTTTYMAGEKFDPTGMVVEATLEDGTTRIISDYTYNLTAPNVEGNSEFVITYNECGKKITTTIPLTIIPFDPTVALIDFEYTENDDGTYTITDWKGTYNGEDSTKLIVPNSSLIIV